MLKFRLGCAIQVEGHAHHRGALAARLMCSTVPWVCVRAGNGICVGVNVETVRKAGVAFRVKLDQWGTGGI